MKYFFFDIDGTLTSFKEYGKIPANTLEAIARLQKTEHFVALATGRARCLAEEFAQKIGIDNYVCEGGNCLVKNNELVYYDYPDTKEIHAFIKQCETLQIPYIMSLEDNKRGYTKYPDFSEDIIKNIKILQELVYDPNLTYQDKQIRRLFVKNDVAKVSQLTGYKTLCLMGYEWSPLRLIEPDDKYRGIAKMVEMLGGSQADIVVFGDGVNDIKMFEKAAFKIAMGNACDELKALSDYITYDSDNDGIGHALRHFGWIKDED
ncbi:MAG: HAD-IIB family hydrolase [Erysipelotrichaceae bacterium]|nr:HAD-IIB family hydrolase [Erysipelotrichaceae bacterium]MDY5252794.1 HAD-IIB family hydrolase [Erysipelotrichaceae bacterium]